MIYEIRNLFANRHKKWPMLFNTRIDGWMAGQATNNQERVLHMFFWYFFLYFYFYHPTGYASLQAS